MILDKRKRSIFLNLKRNRCQYLKLCAQCQCTHYNLKMKSQLFILFYFSMYNSSLKTYIPYNVHCNIKDIWLLKNNSYFFRNEVKTIFYFMLCTIIPWKHTKQCSLSCQWITTECFTTQVLFRLLKLKFRKGNQCQLKLRQIDL